MIRKVSGLRIAFPCASKPFPAPKSVYARLGVSYEKNVVRVLASKFPSLQYNPWFFFQDRYGSGHAVPDVIIPYQDALIIIECKLTYKPEAIIKLKRLYCPVVGLATGKLCIPLVITRYLTPDAPAPAFNISSALFKPEPLLHWIGTGSITY